jgi:hypothetical protein
VPQPEHVGNAALLEWPDALHNRFVGTEEQLDERALTSPPSPLHLARRRPLQPVAQRGVSRNLKPWAAPHPLTQPPPLLSAIALLTHPSSHVQPLMLRVCGQVCSVHGVHVRCERNVHPRILCVMCAVAVSAHTHSSQGTYSTAHSSHSTHTHTHTHVCLVCAICGWCTVFALSVCAVCAVSAMCVLCVLCVQCTKSVTSTHSMHKPLTGGKYACS